jgi:hypothetical protein
MSTDPPISDEEETHLIRELTTLPKEQRPVYVTMVLEKITNATDQLKMEKYLNKLFRRIDFLDSLSKN